MVKERMDALVAARRGKDKSMPTFMRSLLWLGMFFGVLLLHEAIPKTMPAFRTMVSFMWLTFCVVSFFYFLRLLLRFITSH